MSKSKRSGRWLGPAIFVCLFVWGCTAPYYRRQADRDAYRIIQQVEEQLYGQTNVFTIDTRYSQRDPQNIPPAEIIASRHSTNYVFLTLEDAVNLAITNSRNYQLRKEQLYDVALTLTDRRYQFSPHFFGGSEATFTRTESGEKRVQIDSNLGVSQTLKSGATIGLNIFNGLLRYYTGDPREQAISTISANLSQPLLRGFGPKVVTEQLTQAERNVIYEVRDFTHFQNTFATDIVLEYFRVLQQKDRVYNQYQNYLSRSNTTAYLRARAVDREKPLDVDQAEQNELDAKNNYINSIVSYFRALDQFKITLGLPVSLTIEIDEQAIKDLQEAGPIPVYLDEDTGFELAIDHFLPLLNEIDRFEDSKRKIVVAANELKADLGIVSTASLNSQPPTKYTKFNFDDIRVDVGLQLDLPLDRLRERNTYRRTLISFEQEIRSLEQFLDETRNRIVQGIRDVEQFRSNYEIQRMAVSLAERRVQGVELEYKAGETLLRNVLDAQDSLILARNAATQALVDYLEARLNLLLDLGVLNTELEDFWLRDDATTVDLTHPVTRAGEMFEGDRVPPPDQVFQQRKEL